MGKIIYTLSTKEPRYCSLCGQPLAVILHKKDLPARPESVAVSLCCQQIMQFGIQIEGAERVATLETLNPAEVAELNGSQRIRIYAIQRAVIESKEQTAAEHLARARAQLN